MTTTTKQEYMKEYMKVYRQKNRSHLNELSRQWRKTEKGKALIRKGILSVSSDPEKREAARAASRKSDRKARLRDRLEIVARFGGRCARCGFDDWRALQIDHINGGGTKEIDSTSRRSYTRKLLSVDPIAGEYQLLCANCNWIKRYENQESHGAPIKP